MHHLFGNIFVILLLVAVNTITSSCSLNEKHFFNFFIFSLTDKPGEPSNLAVKDISEKTVTLRWSAPDFDGGTPITNYVVEKREGSKKMWQNVSSCTECEFQVAKLIEGNSYQFRVRAENQCGVGEAVELRDLVTPKSAFCE